LLVFSHPVVVSPFTRLPTCVALIRSVHPVQALRRQLGKVADEVRAGGMTPSVDPIRLTRRRVAGRHGSEREVLRLDVVGV
jgi:hypothetical protein